MAVVLEQNLGSLRVTDESQKKKVPADYEIHQIQSLPFQTISDMPKAFIIIHNPGLVWAFARMSQNVTPQAKMHFLLSRGI